MHERKGDEGGENEAREEVGTEWERGKNETEVWGKWKTGGCFG